MRSSKLRIILLFAITVTAVSCVPTSILAKNSELSNNSLKVKRSDPGTSSKALPSLNNFDFEKQNVDTKSSISTASAPPSGSLSNVKGNVLNAEVTNKMVSDDSNGDNETPTMLLHKRGINSELMYDIGGGSFGKNGRASSVYRDGASGLTPDAYNIPIPNGIWSDEIDPALSDLTDYEEYPRAQYRNKAYDNLQNILNSEAYLEPMVLPLQYNNRYYGPDNEEKRLNRNNFNKYDMRLKRESKLTPADMLALVALVEAGERARNEEDDDAVLEPYAMDQYKSPNSRMFYPEFGYQNRGTKNEYNENDKIPIGWLEPAIVDYYGMPYNPEVSSKYDGLKLKHGSSRYPAKRIMISKKKRSLGRSSNEPKQKPISSSLKPSVLQSYF